MHLKRLYYTITKLMCHWINRTCAALPLLVFIMVPYSVLKCVLSYIIPELEVTAFYK